MMNEISENFNTAIRLFNSYVYSLFGNYFRCGLFVCINTNLLLIVYLDESIKEIGRNLSKGLEDE